MWEGVFAWAAFGAALVAAGLLLWPHNAPLDPRRAAALRGESPEPIPVHGGAVAALRRAGRDLGHSRTWAAGVTAGAVLLQALSLLAHQLGR